jgi:hypothetical protein
MFTQAINQQLIKSGFRVRDKNALIAQGRLVITNTPHSMGMQVEMKLDGVMVLSKTVIDVQSVSYTLTDD